MRLHFHSCPQAQRARSEPIAQTRAASSQLRLHSQGRFGSPPPRLGYPTSCPLETHGPIEAAIWTAIVMMVTPREVLVQRQAWPQPCSLRDWHTPCRSRQTPPTSPPARAISLAIQAATAVSTDPAAAHGRSLEKARGRGLGGRDGDRRQATRQRRPPRAGPRHSPERAGPEVGAFFLKDSGPMTLREK